MHSSDVVGLLSWAFAWVFYCGLKLADLRAVTVLQCRTGCFLTDIGLGDAVHRSCYIEFTTSPNAIRPTVLYMCAISCRCSDIFDVYDGTGYRFGVPHRLRAQPASSRRRMPSASLGTHHYPSLPGRPAVCRCPQASHDGRQLAAGAAGRATTWPQGRTPKDRPRNGAHASGATPQRLRGSLQVGPGRRKWQRADLPGPDGGRRVRRGRRRGTAARVDRRREARRPHAWLERTGARLGSAFLHRRPPVYECISDDHHTGAVLQRRARHVTRDRIDLQLRPPTKRDGAVAPGKTRERGNRIKSKTSRTLVAVVSRWVTRQNCGNSSKPKLNRMTLKFYHVGFSTFRQWTSTDDFICACYSTLFVALSLSLYVFDRWKNNALNLTRSLVCNDYR